jgi:hypothetical protein
MVIEKLRSSGIPIEKEQYLHIQRSFCCQDSRVQTRQEVIQAGALTMARSTCYASFIEVKALGM